MAASSLRVWAAGLVGLATPGIGARLIRRFRNMDSRDAAYLAVGASVVTWACAGRWLLFPLLGAGKLSEPKETRGESVLRIKRPDGTELQVEVFGPSDAPTLVLTHGWDQDSTEWYYLKRDLAGRFRLIVWDLPGLGKSSRPSNHDYSLEKIARDLEAVVQLGEGPVVLVGHSIGGMVMQSFCRLFPQHLGNRVTGLVFMDTTYTNPLETARFSGFLRSVQAPVFVPLCYATIALSPLVWALNWLGYFNGSLHLVKRLMGFAGRQTWRQVDFSARLSAKTPPAVAARMALATLGFHEWNTLPGISVPTLVLAGENDRVTTFDANVQIQQRIPGARLVPLRPAGHYALYEHHEAFSRAVAEFVDILQGDTARSVPPAKGFERASETKAAAHT